MRSLLAIIFLLLNMTTLVADATKVDFNTILVGERPGGNVQEYMDEGARWLEHGVKIHVTGNQYSAAAMQILWYHVHGGEVCTEPVVRLAFHQPYYHLLGLKIPNKDYQQMFVQMFGVKNTLLIGPVAVDEWSVILPLRFGIPLCD